MQVRQARVLAVPLAVAALLGSIARTEAQTFDHLAYLRSLEPLSIPAEPIEAPASQPEMGIYKPAGDGPFPAVVVHHTCGGVQEHIGDWTKLLLKAGYAVLVLDSLSQRNLQSICKPPLAVRTIEGALDAYRALELLAAQPYVDKDRIAMLGFSWGAMNALLAARSGIASRLPRESKELGFRAIAAAYPHCLIPSAPTPKGRVDVDYLGLDTDRPLLVLMGESDEETPPKLCLPRLEALKAKGTNVEWHVLPGTTHAWDNRRASGYRAPTLFGGTHAYRYSEEATQASHKHVLEFFQREMPSGKN